jgi:hypothetical protein
MKDMHSSLATFTLDVISDAVVVIKYTEPSIFDIELVNASFQRLCGIARQDLNIGSENFLIDEERFFEVAKEALTRNETLAPREAFQLKKNMQQGRLINIFTLPITIDNTFKISNS